MILKKESNIQIDKLIFNVKNIEYKTIIATENNYDYLLIYQNNFEIFRGEITKSKKDNVNNIIKDIFSNKSDFIDVYQKIYIDNKDLFENMYIDKNFKPKKEYKKEHKNNFNTPNKNNFLSYDFIKNIPIYMVIENLIKNKTLSLSSREDNGSDEVFYKLIDRNNKAYKISVLSHKTYQQNQNSKKKAYFSDVYQEYSSAGIINFIKFLANEGSIPELNKDVVNDDNQSFGVILKYIKNNLLNSIDKKDIQLEDIEDSFSNQKTKLPPRLPIKMKEIDNRFLPFLRDVRKIDEDIIKEEIAKGRIWSGVLFNPTTNRTYSNQTFFKLVNEKGFVDANERLFFSSKDGKNKLEKENLKFGKLRGVSYEINGSKKFKEASIFSEAALDAMSCKNLFKLNGLDPEKYNFISIQGTPHFPKWIKERSGIKINFKEKDFKEFGLASVFEKEEEIKQIEEKHVQSFIDSHKYKNGIENIKNIILIDTQDNENISKYFEIFKNSIFSKLIDIQIHQDKTRNVFYKNIKNFDPKNSFIIDKTNFFDFINENSLYIDTKNNDIKYKSVKEKEKAVDFSNPTEVENIRKKIRHAIKARDFVMAFDNDYDGLKNIETLSKFFKEINMEFKAIIPPKINFENGKQAKDNNDILQIYKEKTNDNDKKYILDEYFATFNDKELLKQRLNSYIDIAQSERINKLKNKKTQNKI